MVTGESPDLTSTIGKCGRFQVTIALIVKGAVVIISWGMLYMAFGSFNPGWVCSDKDIVNISSSSNTTARIMLNLTTQELHSTNTTNWNIDCSLRKECRNIVHNPDTHTVVSQWGLYCDLAWVPSFMISIQMVGVFVGSYVGGEIGDKLGRRYSLFGHLALYSISNLVAIFSNSWEMHAALFFCIGFGIGGVLTIEFPYCLEFMSQYWRGITAAIPVWNIGSLMFSLLIWMLKDWRYVHVVIGVAGCVACLTFFWVPESVRWLTVKGKVDNAKSTIVRIAHVNGRQSPATDIIDDIALQERANRGNKRYTYLDLFKIKSIRGYTIKFGIIWIVMVVTYYMISFGIKSLSGNFYLNFLMFSLVELPAMATVAPAVNRLGRRSAILIYFSLATTCALSVGIIALLVSGDAKDKAILVFTLVCKSSIVAAWAVVCVSSSELYPTVIRSLHYGFISAVSRIGAIVAPYLIPNDPDRIFLPYLIVGGLLFLNCCLMYSLPETKGKALPDMVDQKENTVHQFTEDE